MVRVGRWEEGNIVSSYRANNCFHSGVTRGHAEGGDVSVSLDGHGGLAGASFASLCDRR